MAIDKAKQLRNYKLLATGLFLLALVLYAVTTWLAHAHPAAWVGYVRAFAEAAMVGALADWFAVTALFHHPLGVPIPHTNLIENSKQRIGDNLGNFVSSNFLTPQTIRPYMAKLTVSAYAAEWLGKEKNNKLLVAEAARLLNDIMGRIDDATVAGFMARKGAALLDEIKLPALAANALKHVLDKGEQDQIVTLLAQKIQQFIAENETLVQERVKGESLFFIPGFVNRKLAEKITLGLISYFKEIEEDPAHRVRSEISAELYGFAEKLRTEPKWDVSFQELKSGLLSEDKLQEYSLAAWKSLKGTLQQELTHPDSAFIKYLSKTVSELADNLKNDPALQQKIDGWIRTNAYRYILRNTQQVSDLISTTVGNWQGRELSQKLELEVGKDLQFIRINGTVVGGLAGLVIHAVTELL